MKKQNVRLLDVFVLGPFLIRSGSVNSTLPQGVRSGLVLSGILTIIYNGVNYIENEKRNV